MYREVVAEVRTVTAGPTRGPYERLERSDAKVSRAVPRGLGGSNAPWLPDRVKITAEWITLL